ncbi:hypothetical protein EsH8_X_000377 [Colletotrichum jinshuiense]
MASNDGIDDRCMTAVQLVPGLRLDDKSQERSAGELLVLDMLSQPTLNQGQDQDLPRIIANRTAALLGAYFRIRRLVIKGLLGHAYDMYNIPVADIESVLTRLGNARKTFLRDNPGPQPEKQSEFKAILKQLDKWNARDAYQTPPTTADDGGEKLENQTALESTHTPPAHPGESPRPLESQATPAATLTVGQSSASSKNGGTRPCASAVPATPVRTLKVTKAGEESPGLFVSPDGPIGPRSPLFHDDNNTILSLLERIQKLEEEKEEIARQADGRVRAAREETFAAVLPTLNMYKQDSEPD